MIVYVMFGKKKMTSGSVRIAKPSNYVLNWKSMVCILWQAKVTRQTEKLPLT